MNVQELKPLQLQAYNYIKEKIVSGEYSFNRTYSETSIAQEIGISRTPVRDAVHILYQEGLIDIQPSRGFVLHRITERDVIETYEVRSAIESYCAQKLAQETDTAVRAEAVAALEGSLARQRAIYENGADPAAFSEEDRNFHLQLVGSSRNDAFIEVFTKYMYWIKILASYSLSVAGRMGRTIEEHSRIFEAIRTNDGAGAYNACIAHIKAPLDLNLDSIYKQITK